MGLGIDGGWIGWEDGSFFIFTLYLCEVLGRIYSGGISVGSWAGLLVPIYLDE